jgi:UbiD family decarboxylase
MRNLRVFMRELEENGQLAAVNDEVDCNLEASAVGATSYQNGGPALQFKNIKGYPESLSLASGLFTGPGNLYLEKTKYWYRAAIAMGMDIPIGYAQFLNTCMERLAHPILPLEVDTGPVKEVVKSGADVNVTNLPIPVLHKGDGGRYSTLQTLMVKDLDTDWVVWQNVRAMVLDKNRLAVPIKPDSMLGEIWAKYKATGRSMPCCLVTGGPPLVTITSFLPLARGTSPAAVAGGLNLDPVELVKSETTDLLVPAQAEVVMEGEIDPNAVEEEGPFPEFWFYTEKEFSPVLKVKAMTHRSDPIIPFSVDGVKPSDTHNLMSLMLSLELFRRNLAVRNYPIQWIQMPLEFNLNVVIICGPILFSGYVGWLSKYALSQSRQLGSLYNKVIVVDEKTPEVSLEDAINDVILRIHPNRGYHFVEDMPIGPNARYASADQRAKGTVSGIYLDTSWPKEWSKDDIPRKVSMEGSFPKELLDKVTENYNRLGYKNTPVIYDEAIIPF